MGDGDIHLLYFAWVRERIGQAEEYCALPATVDSVGGLIAWLRNRGPGYAAALAAEGRVRAAVNQVFARAETLVAPGDEVAFFPPVTGG